MAAFVAAIAAVEPGVVKAGLEKAVAMILFGMINWTFTWLSVDGPLTYRDMAPVVAGIFLGGVRNTSAKRKLPDKAAQEHGETES